MATIYSDQYRMLKDLLAAAGKSQDATLLIPDLQRPYIWDPMQVVVLIDSLIRGWPFGTLLTWKVRQDDPVRNLARPFWRVVDRTEDGDDGTDLIGMQHPPAPFQMVLDGQQRVQSLLLALGSDGSGFKMLDRKWHEHLSGTRTRGPRGKPHWSLGCLCVDVAALSEAYGKTRRVTEIDYNDVLRWVVTDDANGRSNLAKPESYKDPLPTASANIGLYVRLSRLWDAAPEQSGTDPYEAEEQARSILQEHGTPVEAQENQKRPLGALLMALTNVKQTRVTYLELHEYENAHGSRESYNDAVVNIFTRLNTAGRTLTREDITFAWLKVGWKTEFTNNRSAKACVEELTRDLEQLSVPISVEDVISAISFVWSVSFNSGKLLNNDDLMKGEAIRPMAADISENWNLVVEAAKSTCEQARDRELAFREQYQSVNALAYLWAWHFLALRWRKQTVLTELKKDSLEQSISASLNILMDRWLICSQWAGVWSSASAQSLGGYATRLAACSDRLRSHAEVSSAIAELQQHLESELKGIEQAAVNGLLNINADDRQQVRGYYTPLWLWNRLDKDRWEKAAISLRQHTRRRVSLDVDHIVAFDLWQSKLDDLKAGESNEADVQQSSAETVLEKVTEYAPACNELGNCMLLEKNFNISKSNKPLKQFLDGVHNFTNGDLSIEVWSAALGLKMEQVDSEKTSAEVLKSLFVERTKTIRDDLEHFVRGTKTRIDI